MLAQICCRRAAPSVRPAGAGKRRHPLERQSWSAREFSAKTRPCGRDRMSRHQHEECWAVIERASDWGGQPGVGSMPWLALMAPACAYIAQWCAPCRRQHAGRPRRRCRRREPTAAQTRKTGSEKWRSRAASEAHATRLQKPNRFRLIKNNGPLPTAFLGYHLFIAWFSPPAQSKGRFRCLKRTAQLRRPIRLPRTRASPAPCVISASPSSVLEPWAVRWRASSSNPSRRASS